jgi:deazaflavin-dependent oxidoreductase (nitroreductase family)
VHFPRVLRRVNRVVTNPLLCTVAWALPPLAIVNHVGRKSGRTYRTPVVAIRSDRRFVIPMTYGRDVDWARNMVRANGCELERTGRCIRLTKPRIVGFEEAGSHLPAAVRPLFRAANLPGYVLADTDTDRGDR